MSGRAPVDLGPHLARLASEEPGERCLAAKELGKAGPAAAGAVKGLTSGLADPDPMVRCMCASALGKIGTAARSAVPGLAEVLRDPVIAVRFWGAYALGHIGDGTPEVRTALEAVAGDDDPSAAPARTAALRALARLAASDGP